MARELAGLSARSIAKVWPELGYRVRPMIDRTYPPHEAGEAHRRMEWGMHFGKLLLEVSCDRHLAQAECST